MLFSTDLKLSYLFIQLNLGIYFSYSMDTFDAIKTRRAIKKFDSTYKISPEDVKALQELTILSPTSYNQQNWRFVYVTDQMVKDKISKAARDQANLDEQLADIRSDPRLEGLVDDLENLSYAYLKA